MVCLAPYDPSIRSGEIARVIRSRRRAWRGSWRPRELRIIPSVIRWRWYRRESAPKRDGYEIERVCTETDRGRWKH